MLIPRLQANLDRALLSLPVLLALSAGLSAEGVPETQPFELSQNSHCGPICLWQIGYLKGLKFSVPEIAGMPKTDRFKGTTVKGMLDAAAAMGLEAEAVTTDLSWLAQDKRTAIVLLDLKSDENKMGHFVIISRIEGDAIVLLDGASTKRLAISDFNALWHGCAILIGSKPPQASPGPSLLGAAMFLTGIVVALIASAGIWLTVSKRFRGKSSRTNAAAGTG